MPARRTVPLACFAEVNVHASTSGAWTRPTLAWFW